MTTSSRRSQDALGGLSAHSRSSHAKDEFCSVTVRKENPKEKAGIRLEQEADGRVRVSNIASNGLFAASEVEIGDIVLSINGKRLSRGEGTEVLVEVVNRAKEKVTVVVKKTSIKPRNKEKPTRNPDEITDNNFTNKDSFHYENKVKHNEDGSLNLVYTQADDKPKQKQDATTISATKDNEEDDGGLVLAVHNKLLFVSEMASASIFQGTSLEVGDRVVSINDMNFRNYADAAYAQNILKKAKTAVTLVVEKGTAGFKKPTKSKLNKTAARKNKKPKDGVSDSDLSSTAESTSSLEDQNETLPLKKSKYKEVVITAPKSFSKQEVGLEFAKRGNNLVVNQIKPKSIFINSSLEQGDIVISVNDVNLRHTADQNLARIACFEAKESVSLLVLKVESKYTEMEFNLDQSSTNLTWQWAVRIQAAQQLTIIALHTIRDVTRRDDTSISINLLSLRFKKKDTTKPTLIHACFYPTPFAT